MPRSKDSKWSSADVPNKHCFPSYSIHYVGDLLGTINFCDHQDTKEDSPKKAHRRHESLDGLFSSKVGLSRSVYAVFLKASDGIAGVS